MVGSGGCFNPDEPAAETDAATDGSSSASTTLVPSTTGSGSGSDSTSSTMPTVGGDTETGDEDSGDSSTGGEVPQWGEGEPPDFGDLGDEGEGSVLVVHALEEVGAVDVWLVGADAPVVTDLEPGRAALAQGVLRDARRVVLARAGTTEAVACSDWFPLRAGEQWATVAARAEHTCPSPVVDGGTVTFEQELALTGNTVRYVHAAAPDDLNALRSGVAEPGVLSPLQSLPGADLPDCATAGCVFDYAFDSDALSVVRDYTFITTELADVPPAGEVLFVVVGDIRQDWPNESDALEVLVVDVEGGVRPVGRDPELAVAAPQLGQDVVFSILAQPAIEPFATAAVCNLASCELSVQQFRPGPRLVFAGEAGASPAEATLELEPGRRYLLVYDGEQLLLVSDDFTREDQAIAAGRAYNTAPDLTLTIGRIFGGMGQAFDAFVDVPPGAVSDEAELPVGNWDLVTSFGGGALGTGCLSPITTEAGWRGILNPDFTIALDQWPPREARLLLLCS